MAFYKPAVDQRPSRKENLAESISLASLVFTWLLVIAFYPVLPATIPVHFNGAGMPDNYGIKALLFIMPVIVLFIFTLLTLLIRSPYLLRFKGNTVSGNKAAERRRAAKLMRTIKMVSLLFVLVITIDFIYSANLGHSVLPWWIVPLFMICMIAPVLGSIYKSSKKVTGKL